MTAPDAAAFTAWPPPVDAASDASKWAWQTAAWQRQVASGDDQAAASRDLAAAQQAVARASQETAAALKEPGLMTHSVDPVLLQVLRDLTAAIASLGGNMPRTARSNSVTLAVAPIVWTISPSELSMVSGDTVDLSKTLPDSLAKGGVYAVASGTLPAGVTLDPTTGALHAEGSAAAAKVEGLVFSYTEPKT